MRFFSAACCTGPIPATLLGHNSLDSLRRVARSVHNHRPDAGFQRNRPAIRTLVRVRKTTSERLQQMRTSPKDHGRRVVVLRVRSFHPSIASSPSDAGCPCRRAACRPAAWTDPVRKAPARFLSRCSIARFSSRQLAPPSAPSPLVLISRFLQAVRRHGPPQTRSSAAAPAQHTPCLRPSCSPQVCRFVTANVPNGASAASRASSHSRAQGLATSDSGSSSVPRV